MPKKNKATKEDARIYLQEVFGVKKLEEASGEVKQALRDNAAMGHVLDKILVAEMD